MTGKLKETERGFQNRVIAFARMHGWRVAHFRPARRRDGTWHTPMQGDTGFPDLVLAKNGVVLFVELKSDRGKLTEGQKAWAHAISLYPPPSETAHDFPFAWFPFFVWRPADWERVCRLLAHPAREWDDGRNKDVREA